MGEPVNSGKQFLEALAASCQSETRVTDESADLRRALLDYASETPDNLRCADSIVIGSDGNERGLRLAGSYILLSDLAHELEDVPLPAALSAALPELTEEDWAAFSRLTTLIFTALGRHQKQ